MLFALLKTLHVLGAMLFLGAGLMTAYYKTRADRSGDLRVIAWCQAEIVRADWIFTLPSAFLLPSTGIGLALLYGAPLTRGWVGLGLLGFALSGLLWLPAVHLQLKMKALAEEALRLGAPLPEAFHRANRQWLLLGLPAFAIALGTVWIMVSKWSP
ncbi:MAG: DUF2269 domain-containing protein [Myxococcales bacterium]|nr:DUF2269 domain-containing protein [Myxococcales bacterium]